jgi:hypothetical protein
VVGLLVLLDVCVRVPVALGSAVSDGVADGKGEAVMLALGVAGVDGVPVDVIDLVGVADDTKLFGQS